MPKRRDKKVELENVSSFTNCRSLASSDEVPVDPVGLTFMNDETMMKSNCSSLNGNSWVNFPDSNRRHLLANVHRGDRFNDSRIITSPFNNWWTCIDRKLYFLRASQERKMSISPTLPDVPNSPENKGVERTVHQERFDNILDEETEDLWSNPTEMNNPEAKLRKFSLQGSRPNKTLERDLHEVASRNNSLDVRLSDQSEDLKNKSNSFVKLIGRKKYDSKKRTLLNSYKKMSLDRNLSIHSSKGHTSVSKTGQKSKIPCSELISSENDSLNDTDSINHNLPVRQRKTGRFYNAFQDDTESTESKISRSSKTSNLSELRIPSNLSDRIEIEERLSFSPSNAQEVRKASKKQRVLREPLSSSEESELITPVVQRRKNIKSPLEVMKSSKQNTSKTTEPLKTGSEYSKNFLHNISNKDLLSEISNKLPDNKDELILQSKVNRKCKSTRRVRDWIRSSSEWNNSSDSINVPEHRNLSSILQSDGRITHEDYISKLSNQSRVFHETPKRKQSRVGSNIHSGGKKGSTSLEEIALIYKNKDRLELRNSVDGPDKGAGEMQTKTLFPSDNDNLSYSNNSGNKKGMVHGLSVTKRSKSEVQFKGRENVPVLGDCEVTNLSKSVDSKFVNKEFEMIRGNNQLKQLREDQISSLKKNECIAVFPSDQNRSPIPPPSAIVHGENNSTISKKEMVKSFNVPLPIDESDQKLSISKSTKTDSPVIAFSRRRRKWLGLEHKDIAKHSESASVTSGVQSGTSFLHYNPSMKRKIPEEEISRKNKKYPESTLINKSDPKDIASRANNYDTTSLSSVSEMLHHTTNMSNTNKNNSQKEIDVENAGNIKSSNNTQIKTKSSTSQRILSQRMRVEHKSKGSLDEKSEKGDGLILESPRLREDECNILSPSTMGNNVSGMTQKLTTDIAQHGRQLKKLKLQQYQKSCEQMQKDTAEHAKRLESRKKMDDLFYLNKTDKLAARKECVKIAISPLSSSMESVCDSEVTVKELKTKTKKKKTPQKTPSFKRPPWLHMRWYKGLSKFVTLKIKNQDVEDPEKKAEEIISGLVNLIEKTLCYRRKGRNPFVDDVIKYLYHSGIIKTPINFICFCMDYLPEPFIHKALRCKENDSGILGDVVDQDLNL